jgi:Arc/MetJ-type ribon-helix-helix transcriptional regulator
MTDTERVTVRLPSDTLTLLQSLVDEGQFSSLSEAVVTAVNDLIGARLTPEDVEEILASPKEDDLLEIDAIMVDGPRAMAGSMEAAIRDYVRQRRGSQ